MDIHNLQDIIKLMEEHGLSELCLEEESLKLTLKRGVPPTLIPVQTASAPLQLPQTRTEVPVTPRDVMEEKNIYMIKSPMVGTFYAAPSPDSDPFVKAGDKVNENSVVCILEAMKVMNEIRAECNGEIVEVLVASGTPVEYGQALFKVKLNA